MKSRVKGPRDRAPSPPSPGWFEGSSEQYAELAELIRQEAREGKLLALAAASFLAAACLPDLWLGPVEETGLWLAGWLFLLFASERFDSRTRRVLFFDLLCAQAKARALPPMESAPSDACELKAWRRLRKEERSWMRPPTPKDPPPALSNDSDK